MANVERTRSAVRAKKERNPNIILLRRFFLRICETTCCRPQNKVKKKRWNDLTPYDEKTFPKCLGHPTLLLNIPPFVHCVRRRTSQTSDVGRHFPRLPVPVRALAVVAPPPLMVPHTFSKIKIEEWTLSDGGAKSFFGGRGIQRTCCFPAPKSYGGEGK